MAPTATFDLTSKVKYSPGLRSIDVNPNGKLLCGTRGADVIELNAQGNIERTIVQGHF